MQHGSGGVVRAAGGADLQVGPQLWSDGKVSRVRVFVMLPAPGAPNRWLHEQGDDSKMLRPVPFADYTLELGQPISVTEMKALGLEPWVIRLAPAPPAESP